MRGLVQKYAFIMYEIEVLNEKGVALSRIQYSIIEDVFFISTAKPSITFLVHYLRPRLHLAIVQVPAYNHVVLVMFTITCYRISTAKCTFRLDEVYVAPPMCWMIDNRRVFLDGPWL